jgi:hypothetical protein
VVWCGVVWCGVVWCGVVWCGVVWCGVVWCGVVWCGVVWCGVEARVTSTSTPTHWHACDHNARCRTRGSLDRPRFKSKARRGQTCTHRTTNGCVRTHLPSTHNTQSPSTHKNKGPEIHLLDVHSSCAPTWHTPLFAHVRFFECFAASVLTQM